MPRGKGGPLDGRSARWAIEELGWLPAKVTQKITIPGQPWARNVDLWGWGDTLMLAPGYNQRWEAILVNTCGARALSSHVKTLQEKATAGLVSKGTTDDPAHLWRFQMYGGSFEVWEWRKLKRRLSPKRRKRLGRTHTLGRYWKLRRVGLYLRHEFGEVVVVREVVDPRDGAHAK